MEGRGRSLLRANHAHGDKLSTLIRKCIKKLHLKCDFDIGTAKENGMFNVVSTCSYGFTLDAVKIDSELQNRKQTWKDHHLNIAEEEKKWLSIFRSVILKEHRL